MRGKGVRSRSQLLRKLLEGLGFPGGQHHLGPAPTNALAMAAPMPRDAPVTMATRSSSEKDPGMDRSYSSPRVANTWL